MSDFEYFFTIGMFVAGFVLLVYLFRIRAKLMRKAYIQYLNAKAKIHHMTRPTPEVWGVDTFREKEIR